MIITGISIAILIVFTLQKEWSVLAYVLCFFWGWQDSGLNIIVNTIMGFEFEDKTTPYAACRVVRNSMIALFSVVQGYIIITPDWEIARGMDKERNIYLWYVILAGIEGLLGVFMVLFF